MTCPLCFVRSLSWPRYWKKALTLKPTKHFSKSSLCSKSARKRLWSASSGKRSPQKVMGCGFLCLGSSRVAFCRFGSGVCHICMEDPQGPLGLPCDHIYCQACLKQWLKPHQMVCPICKQPVNDDFQIVPSEAVQSVTHSKTPESCCSSAEIGCLL